MSTPSATADLLDRVADLVEAHYVLPAPAHQIAAHLRAAPAPPDPEADPAGFAQLATTLLRATNGDRHLSVRYRPEGVQDEQDEATWRREYATQARANAGGISAVSRHQQAATLVVAPSLSPVEYARAYVNAAMRLIDGASSLVIDLRACRGGTPATVAHLCGYFLGPRPVHLQDVVSRDGRVERFTTEPDRLDAPRQPDLPIVVLTSAATFSGGEDLAYTLQALHRATVVGEQTGGGAHPRQSFTLTATLEVHVPVARSVNAATGGNWEGIGVLPDRPCHPEAAPLEAAKILSHQWTTASSRP